MSTRACAVSLSILAAACAFDATEGDRGVLEDAETQTGILVLPIRTAGSYQVIGYPDTADLEANVDDGTAPADADGDASYVRGKFGVAFAAHRVRYQELPAGTVTQLDVTVRARAAAGATGTLQVELYDGDQLVAAGARHPVGASWQSVTDRFTGLSIADGNRIATRVVLRNSAGTGALRYTQVFASASIAAGAPLKPPCRGLMTRAGLPASGMPFVDHSVVQVHWRDLEATDQQFDWRPIDDAIAALKARGVKGARLRILAGIRAPDFVKKKGHAPMSAPGIDCSQSGGIAIYNKWDDVGACSTFFWTDPVLDEYEELMRAVAARYDADPFVREVVNSACMTVYAEPFFRAHADVGSNTRLWQAGLDLAVDRACHERAIELHDALFAETRTSLAINRWDIIDDSSDHHVTSWTEAKAFVDWARGRMGGKLVLQNNGKGEDPAEQCLDQHSPDTSYWCYLDEVPGPKGFQTETWQRLGGASGLYDAIEQSLGMGANFVELPGGYADADASVLADLDAALEATACCASAE